jgi:hypothetical protein
MIEIINKDMFSQIDIINERIKLKDLFDELNDSWKKYRIRKEFIKNNSNNSIMIKPIDNISNLVRRKSTRIENKNSRNINKEVKIIKLNVNYSNIINNSNLTCHGSSSPSFKKRSCL